MKLSGEGVLHVLREADLLRHVRGVFPSDVEIVTDTRAAIDGRVFLALRGERFDGNAHAPQAAAQGAIALILDDPNVACGEVPRLLVTDGAEAYLALARLAREQACERGARVAALTGSAGKTTTKDFLAHLIRACADVAPGRIVATHANENNEIGVAKLLTGLPEDVAYVVAEFGARKPHDIAPLVRVAAPEVAVVTNIGEAHLEIFGSRERLSATKFEIVASCAHAIVNACNAPSRERVLADPSLARRTVWFAALETGDALPDLPGDLVALRRAEGGDCDVFFREASTERTVRANCTVPGTHNLGNAAAALAALRALGLGTNADEPRALAALATLALPHGRYERGRIGAFETIFDAYNASPEGMLAALRTFACEPAQRRIAVLGSMAELGAESIAAHRRVGAGAAAADLAVLLVGGAYAADLEMGAREAGMPNERIVHFPENAAAARWLRANARPGDVVFFKGSRAYRLEEILEGLHERAS